MNHNPIRARRAAALLLAAAALPFTPALAQEAQTPPTDPPVAETPAEPTPQPQPETTAPDPAPIEATATPPAAETPAPVRRTERTTTTRTAATRAPVRVAPAPVPAPLAVSPPSAPAADLPAAGVEALPPAAADLATAAPEELPVQPVQPEQAAPAQESGGGSMWPWLLAGLLALGAAAFLLMRRRRRHADDAVYHEDYREETPAHAQREPVVDEPVAAAPIAAAAPVAAAAAADAGRPEIELSMRPRRAGVDGQDARVEFELTVGNSGSAPAENLRVSTWMLAAGSSEAERALIEPRDHADTPPITIDAGEARTMEAAVALPTSQVHGDSVLPVVVADARYVLPDGTEEHRAVSFAVGVPVEGELAYFDTENPSGLHEGVEARPFGGKPD